MRAFLKPAVTALVLWLTALPAFSQAPAITYTTPNVYIVDAIIQPLNPANTGGTVPASVYSETKLIAGTGAPGNNDGSASTARFVQAYGLTVDPDGNIYLAEAANYRIRKITPGGVVTTIAPDGIPGSPNIASPKFNTPHGVVRDATGNLYVANYGNHNILKIVPDGTISVFAGGFGNNGLPKDGQGTDASIINPNGIAIDAAGNLYVSDGSNLIRKISPTGYVYTFVGSGTAATVDGKYTAASFNNPAGLTVDANGNIFVAEQGGRVIRKITPNGDVTTIAGSGQFGTADGTGAAASFQAPMGTAVDPSGNLYVTDAGSGTIRRISPDNEVVTIAGGGPAGVNSGIGKDVNFSMPGGITINPEGNLYVAEINGDIIKQVVATGYIIDKQLPPGLLFDPKTGIISGTPTVTWPATDYKITAFNAGGSSSFVVNIKVNAVPDPTLIASSATGSISTCLGSASTNYQEFTMSGEGLTDDIVINAPAGFEVSLSPDLGYATTLTIPLVTLDPDGTEIYVRMASTATAGAHTGNVVLSSNGASDVTVAVSGEVKPVVTPSVTIAQQAVGCPGEEVTFIATPINAGNSPVYRWFVNGTEQATHTTIFKTAAISGTDILTFTLTNTDDCTTIADAHSNPLQPQYKQSAEPEITIKTTTANTTVCADVTVSFEALPGIQGSNITYQWLLDGVNAGHPTPQPFYSVTSGVSGSYKVSCIITNTDAASCAVNPQKTSNEITIFVLPSTPPVVSIIPLAGYPACEGSSVSFTATSPDAPAGSVYQWQLNHINVVGSGSTFSSSTLKAGDVLTCTISNLAQCSAPGISDDFIVQVNAVPVVSFNGDVTIKKGESIMLDPVLPVGTFSYNWSPSSGLSDATIANPIASPVETTSYTLKVTNTTGGCPAFANIKVNVVSPMIIPNAFTPNADGINDTWSIPALTAYPNCTVNVFNRYGASIFRSIGYSKDWNGSFNGYVLPSGTYYYVVDLKNGSKPLSGYVVLLK